MTRLLGTLVWLGTVLVLAGCGSDASTGGSPPGSPGPHTITPTTAKVVPGPNAARGRRDTVATELPDRAAVKAYADRLAGPLRLAVTKAATPLLRRDGTLYAQTIFDGCGTPPVGSLTVTKRASGEVVISTSYSDPANLDCLVAVRSVALVVLP